MEYQEKSLKKYRNREVFSTFWFIVTSESLFWTGVWFKNVNITEELVKVRYQDFDEWSCKFYWKKWKEKWVFYKIKK